MIRTINSHCNKCTRIPGIKNSFSDILITNIKRENAVVLNTICVEECLNLSILNFIMSRNNYYYKYISLEC